MNIRRQYSLPNCTLVLEGFDDGTNQLAQTLAVLSNVECHFVNSKQLLNGGKVFFDHLVCSVSEYVQGLLSGLHHPPDAVNPEGQIIIETLQPQNIHRLVWKQDGSETNISEVHLSTAELFDLTEAIDQFLADALTLPNFSLPLAPLSRRHCVPERSLAERAVPSVIGIGGFALTAFALFFVPAPEKSQTTNPNAEANGQEQTTSADQQNKPPALPETAAISNADLENLINTVPEVKDDLSLKMMQLYLYRTLDQAWQERQPDTKLAYRLSLAKDGSIVGYQPLDGTPADAVSGTPLAELGYTPIDQAIATSEAVGQFKVVFDGKSLEVSPWHGFRGDVSFDSGKVRGQVLRQLIVDVRKKITDQLSETPVSTTQPLKYNVGVTDDGAIALVMSEDGTAEAALSKTPLAKLLQPEAAGIKAGESVIPQESLTQVVVVFRPNGVVEVSPWVGYR